MKSAIHHRVGLAPLDGHKFQEMGHCGKLKSSPPAKLLFQTQPSLAFFPFVDRAQPVPRDAGKEPTETLYFHDRADDGRHGVAGAAPQAWSQGPREENIPEFQQAAGWAAHINSAAKAGMGRRYHRDGSGVQHTAAALHSSQVPMPRPLQSTTQDHSQFKLPAQLQVPRPACTQP